MPHFRSISVLAFSLVISLVAGLGCTTAQVYFEPDASQLPRPDRVLVYDFATSPEDVKLDRGLSARVVDAAKSASPTEQERELGTKVASALAKKLVEELQGLGMTAQRTSGMPPTTGDSLLIEGQFVTINQGNRTERIAIGLGAGRSDVETHVQVLMAQEGSDQKVVQLDVSAKGSRKPGAAETLGVGALTGNLVISGAVTAGGTAVSEGLSGTVEADASRTAKKIVEELKPFFKRNGWISSD
jgi:hypothetical protein